MYGVCVTKSQNIIPILPEKVISHDPLLRSYLMPVLNSLFFYDKIFLLRQKKAIKSNKKYKNTTNLIFINLKFIDIRFMNLRFIDIRFINSRFIKIRFIKLNLFAYFQKKSLRWKCWFYQTSKSII